MSRYDHKIETSLEGIADDKTLLPRNSNEEKEIEG